MCRVCTQNLLVPNIHATGPGGTQSQDRGQQHLAIGPSNGCANTNSAAGHTCRCSCCCQHCAHRLVIPPDGPQAGTRTNALMSCAMKTMPSTGATASCCYLCYSTHHRPCQHYQLHDSVERVPQTHLSISLPVTKAHTTPQAHPLPKARCCSDTTISPCH